MKNLQWTKTPSNFEKVFCFIVKAFFGDYANLHLVYAASNPNYSVFFMTVDLVPADSAVGSKQIIKGY